MVSRWWRRELGCSGLIANRGQCGNQRGSVSTDGNLSRIPSTIEASRVAEGGARCGLTWWVFCVSFGGAPRCAALTCARVAPGGARWGLVLGRSALRADSAAMLGSGSRRRTRYAHFVSCARTAAASQITKRAARADPKPPLLAVPQVAPTGHRLPRVHRFGLPDGSPTPRCEAAPGQATACVCGAEERRAHGRARQRASSSPRLSECSERSERSEFGGGPWG